MKSLYINTVEKNLSLGFKDDNDFYEFKSDGSKTQNEEIFEGIKNILNGNNIRDLDFITILTGPGSFTGIRLGISIVKGFVLGENVPVITIDNFKAVYYSIKNEITNNFAITIDAGGNDIFYTEMDKYGNNISEKQIIKKDELKYSGKIFENIQINPEKVLIEIEKDFDKNNFKQQTIEPTYIKPHYAKIKKV